MARCLFVVSDELWTGRARALVAGACGLAAREHAVVVMADASSAAFSQVRRGVTGENPKLQALPPRMRRGGTSRVRALRREIRANEADVIFVHNDADHLAVALALVGLSRKPSIVRRVAVGERVRPTRVGRIAERLALPIHLLTGRQGIDRADIASPRFRVELGVAVPKNETPPSLSPLLVCAYDPLATNYASRVLRAVTMLRKRHRHLTLCMVATTEVPERLRMQAAALGLSRVVRWLRTPAGTDEVLAQAWALVVAVGGDEALYATLDSMAHGVPLVAPRSALFERYVANGISGILLDSFDAAACAAALATLVSDPDRRDAMGGAARARVARDYPETEYIEGLEVLLRSVVANRATGEPFAGVA